MRLTELLLFLTPFVAFVVWRLTIGAGGPSRGVLIAAAVTIAVLAVLLVWLRQDNAVPPGVPYVPAHLQNGRVIPGDTAP